MVVRDEEAARPAHEILRRTAPMPAARAFQVRVRATESVLEHIAATIIGFILMVIGLGLGVTPIMLPSASSLAYSV